MKDWCPWKPNGPGKGRWFEDRSFQPLKGPTGFPFGFPNQNRPYLIAIGLDRFSGLNPQANNSFCRGVVTAIKTCWCSAGNEKWNDSYKPCPNPPSVSISHSLIAPAHPHPRHRWEAFCEKMPIPNNRASRAEFDLGPDLRLAELEDQKGGGGGGLFPRPVFLLGFP